MYNSYYRDLTVPHANICNNDVQLQLNCVCKIVHPNYIHATTSRKDYYLFWLCDGTVTVDAPVKATINAGDLFIFEKDVPFSYSSEDKVTTHYSAHFTGYMADKLLSQVNLKTSTVYSIGAPERIFERFNKIFKSFIIRDEFFDIDTANQLIALLVDIGRIVSSKQTAGFGAANKRLKTSLEYIHQNFDKDISPSELARLEFLSESRYRALFCSALKQSPTEYISNLRMSTACNLLMDKEISIQTVAKMVGFNDQRYFSRQFKKKYGISPSEYQLKSV